MGYQPRKTNKILTAQQQRDALQPLDKDGFTNEAFDRVYGKDKNPFRGTERDRDKRKRHL